MSLNRTLANLINTDGDVKAANLDLAASITVVEALDSLPTSNLTAGDQAYVKGTSRFYVSNGAGWYNAALVNATPSLSIDPSGAITLATDGSTTTITLTATDSDYPDAALTYTVESDGSFGGLATLSQDSSVFTITPLSEDSATTTSAVLTFKASDGVSFGSADRTLTLEFKVANSNYTTLMLKADTAGTDNQVDASTIERTLTEAGNVTSTAFTPYHPGGYSTYFDGSAEIEVTEGSDEFGFGTSDYTIEWWFNVDTISGVQCMVTNSEPTDWQGCWYGLNNANLYILHGNGSNTWNIKTGSAVEANRWYHIAVVNNGGTISVYLDGSTTTSGISNYSQPYTWTDGNDAFHIGGRTTAAIQRVTGNIRDVRIVKGTAVYTSNFTPPDKPLTAITNTSLLLCHLPYIADGSSNSLATAVSGNTKTERFGPFDYLSYSKAEYGGSVYFDGTDDNLSFASSADFNFGSSDWTIEAWLYQTARDASNVCRWYMSGTNGSGNAIHISINPNGTLDCGRAVGGGVITGTSTEAMPLNTWNHVVATKEGSNGYLYLNGKQVSTSGSATEQTSGDVSLRIGYDTVATVNEQFTGYMADLHVIKGTRKYTADFTPPTAPVTAVTNTKLLTCTNKNEFFDASANAPVMTPGGSVAANASEVSYTGNSIYFSTRSDEISGNGTLAAFNTLPGDFTIELECKLTSSNMAYAFVFQLYSGSNNDNAIIRFGDSGYGYHLQFIINNGGGASAVYNVNLVQSDFTSEFRHIAWTRESGTNRVFIDGTQYNVATGTNPSTFTSASWSDSTTISFNHADGIRIGLGSYAPLGYLQNIRVTNGLARYTSSFTPPTEEFSG